MGARKKMQTWGAAIVTLALALSPAPVLASDIDELEGQANTLLARIEETTATYQQAAAEVADLEARIDENEAKIAELGEALPAQRARTAAAIKTLYIFQQSNDSLLNLLLSAEDFEDFIQTLHYLDAIHAHNTREIANLSRMNEEYVQAQQVLVTQRDAAKQRQDDALVALNEARAARAELQQRAIQVAITETEVREEAIEVARAAIESAVAEEEPATFETASGNVVEIQVPPEPSVTTEPLVTNTTQPETEGWAERIDAYLEGSPLEGYGQVFADAAATYGVDPRLSPAISTIESSKGEYTFKDHNAWGWGSESWDSWEDAIYDQVQGLAEVYDGTLTYEGAEMYCPPSADEWYSSVASEMDSI